jgi:DNA damage-inducible protein 1
MNEENQRKIEDAIRNENIMQNMEMAIENLPEAFGRVQMLFVNITINGNFIKAFVDSGAQSTIMSEKCAERCNIMRLLDKRFAGEARGVGTAKILGRIHIAQMKFGQSFYPVSITVLEKSDIEMLFGLDTLRRYNCVIDLGRNVLRVSNGNDSKGEPMFEELSFLGDAEIPRSDADMADERTPAVDSVSSSSGSGSGRVSNNNSSNQIPVSSSATNPSASSVPASVSALTSAVGATAISDTDTHTSKVAELTALGFSVEQAQAALAQAGGDVNLAASLLMEML